VSTVPSVFNVEDNCRDTVVPGAFKKTLEKKNVKNDIKLLWQHVANKPIGYFDTIKEDAIGLYVEGHLMLNIQQGLEAYSLIKNKVINSLSIGYFVKSMSHNKLRNSRTLKEIDLLEISVVTFPANEYANITFCKNISYESMVIKKIKIFEKLLDTKTYGKSCIPFQNKV
jgi:HK97 family phage prohead protease